MHSSAVERLAESAAQAVGRFRAIEDGGTNPDVFAPLGEALFWLVALGEANGHERSELIRGLKWARNRVTHGAIVAAPVSWHYGAEVGRAVVGRAVLGTRSGHRWVPRDDVETTRDVRPDAHQNAAYDARLSGQYVLAVLEEALTTEGGRP